MATEEYFEYKEPAAVGVSFRRSGKVYYFAPGGLRVRQGDQVLAETDKGLDIGEVVFVKYEAPETEGGKPLKALVRKATEQDLAKEKELQQKERAARRICEEKIAAHNLPMRLIAADYTFDGQRLVFFFSAESRVDFRALVRDLAETFKTRIELRQVGVRDQAKMVGGLGPCGRPLCCNAFLRNFDPVGIRVAKDQGLSLNPAKISGICDRLMCCLKYEHETYLELAKKLPKAGTTVNTPKGQAVVKSVNLMHERVQVKYPDDEVEELKASQVWALGAERPAEVTVGATHEERPEAPAAAMGKTRTGLRPARGERGGGRREAGRRGGREDRGTGEAGGAGAAAPPVEEEATSSSRRRRRRRDRKPREVGQTGTSAPPAPPGVPASQVSTGQTGVSAPGEGGRRRPRSRRRRPGSGTPPAQG